MRSTTSLFFICLILASCEAEHIKPGDIRKAAPFYSTRDISCFKTGRYSGTMHLVVPGHTDITNPAYREIFQHNSNYVLRWWTAPDTTAIALIRDTLRYEMRYDRTNTSCGLQRAIYNYSVISTRRGDSIHDSGSVRYRWSYNNELLKDMPGTFTAKLKWVDSKTPNRSKWENQQ